MELQEKIRVLRQAYMNKYIAVYLGISAGALTYKIKDVGKFTYTEVLKIEQLYSNHIMAMSRIKNSTK
jgi:hypothetical protein